MLYGYWYIWFGDERTWIVVVAVFGIGNIPKKSQNFFEHRFDICKLIVQSWYLVNRYILDQCYNWLVMVDFSSILVVEIICITCAVWKNWWHCAWSRKMVVMSSYLILIMKNIIHTTLYVILKYFHVILIDFLISCKMTQKTFFPIRTSYNGMNLSAKN